MVYEVGEKRFWVESCDIGDGRNEQLICLILVRESGTEPLVRVMVEAPDHDTCQKYVDEVVNVIDSKGYRV